MEIVAKRAVCVALLLLILAGCDSSPRSAQPSSSPSSAAALGRSGCNPPSPSTSNPREFQATIQSSAVKDAELWAQLFADQPILAGQDVKIVWRIPADGGGARPHFEASLADGTTATLTFGPQPHGASTWGRPGVQYGTSFLFPKAGCWDIQVTTGKTTGDLWLVVK